MLQMHMILNIIFLLVDFNGDQNEIVTFFGDTALSLVNGTFLVGFGSVAELELKDCV